MEIWPRSSTTSQRLQQALDEAGMKQADLAKATGLPKGGISNYVTGRYEPKSDVINKLAKALNVSEMWLWGYDVPKERPIKFSPYENKITEGEQILLDLFRRVQEDQQKLVLQMIRAALGTQE